MAYFGIVTNLKNIHPHPNADKLQLGECFGNTVCVNLDYYENIIGVYFPEGGQLSEEFCEHNNLMRKKDENGNNVGGYLDPNKRNIVAIRLRGEISDGLFLPLSCLDYCFNREKAVDNLQVGDKIDTVNGHFICQKYIPIHNKTVSTKPKTSTSKKKIKVDIAPLFRKHVDTAQLAYNLDKFNINDIIEISLKLHGTSGRTGYLPILTNSFTNRICRFFNKNKKPIYKYDYISGSRQVVLSTFGDGGYYGNNKFREKYHNFFKEKLWKGETIYYEIVGFIDNGTPIMGIGKVPKEAQNQYGKEMVFHYGCESPASNIYVYRMTMTNEDGQTIEYTPAFMRHRCEEIGVNVVPVFETFIVPEGINAGEYVKQKVEEYYDGPDPIGKTHVREGVVVRILNRPTFEVYKHKNFLFKQISGIIADSTPIDNNLSEDIYAEL